MIIVSIKKDGQVTNQGQFESMQAAQEWLAYHEGLKTFGEPTRTVQQQIEVSPAVLDEQGVEIMPAQFEMQEVTIPGSYIVEMSDVTAQKLQEKINQEALQYLAETDWYVVRSTETGAAIPQEVLDERAAARARIVR